MPVPAQQFRNFKVVVSVLALIALIVIYSGWSISSSFNIAVKAAEVQSAGYAKALSEHAERAFSEADRVLVDTIEDLTEIGRKHELSGMSSEIKSTLVRHASGAPQIGAIIVINKRGILWAHSLSDTNPRIDSSDRDFYRFHKENPGAGLFISRPFKSRLTGAWRFTLSRPILDSRGNFDGIVAAAFDIDYFQKFYKSINVGKNWRIVLVHRTSPVLIMEPFSEKSMTLDYKDSVLFRKKLPHSREGTFHLEKGIVLDTQARVISYMSLQQFPVIALVSFSRDEILAPWKSSAIKHALTTIILCCAVILLAVLHLRQLKSLEAANSELLAQRDELKSGEEHRRHVEAQLFHAQKMESVGQLAAGIAHDFNNLLTPIIGYAEIIKNSGRASPEHSVKLDGIMGAAQRAKELTKQLLGFARKQVMSMAVIDLNRVITSFTIILHRAVRESVEIQLLLHSDPVLVRADQSQLEHVLLNLAVNAQDAITGHGSIIISTSLVDLDAAAAGQLSGLPAGRYVQLSFTDTGSGIDGGVIDHIFEPFFTTKPSGQGTGLGLAMVYGVIRQHNGAIAVESSPGSGTVFTIYLPAAEGAVEPEIADIRIEPAKSGSARVLVVEDNEMVRDMVVHILEAEGHCVNSTESSGHGLMLAEEADIPFDLLVSDVVMPGMNGPAMYNKMLETSPGLKAIFISGYSDDSSLIDAIDFRSALFLQKPFTVDEFLDTIRKSLS